MNLEGDKITHISYALAVKTHQRGNPRNLEDQIIEKILCIGC
jgi:hypothetical protein